MKLDFSSNTKFTYDHAPELLKLIIQEQNSLNESNNEFMLSKDSIDSEISIVNYSAFLSVSCMFNAAGHMVHSADVKNARWGLFIENLKLPSFLGIDF
ncbi:3357_t:CDS:2 [Ambispora gerdemannii]|uniref:3357_t:CDS:1 n=1 Tax=Ambispora gerdemannii TaxID=144530 RepID=A0A9N9FYW2_9GLOM|nr:3357_t:CDS:2 [Ambispora gerdemannii]